jgi:DnaJ-class molecular chaperone
VTFTEACKLLGMPTRYATWRRVRDAYRELARTTHPDAGGDRSNWDLLQEAYATLRVAFSVPQTCPTCHGDKRVAAKGFQIVPCPSCNGKGELPPQTIGPQS